jgi:hypothetical protein
LKPENALNGNEQYASDRLPFGMEAVKINLDRQRCEYGGKSEEKGDEHKQKMNEALGMAEAASKRD